ncbi:hypothetical protein HMPREF1214_04655 [Bacteroides sp. HPS0048]|uniref:hypothetical protein n=1 Tax=Bacteroides sp. HPS0048 TaxID=1078089 RepID=UPI000367A696|nr:hypothetical protein [Bacteroides sp. HPS0048]EOA52570.1 hypothetical protein HMPREF1214_04655 [Bacteroides sp. HPS0048]
MNYFKLLTIFLLSFTMIACSSDEDFNTQEATVEFQSAEIEVKELTSILNLPIVVKGERNGLIKVHVILKENNSGFESEKAILITEDHLSIPMRTESVNVETLLSIANEQIVQNRYFSIAIADVEGATAGSINTCKINIVENSPIEGKYSMEGKSQLPTPTGVTGYACTFTSVVNTFQQIYLDFGHGGAAIADVEATGNEGEYKLTITASQPVGMYSDNRVELTHKQISGGMWIKTSEPIIGIYKDKVISFEVGHALGLEIPALNSWLGLVGSYTDDNGKSVPLKFIKQ